MPAMPGYGQFCPVAQALEIVGERWTLLIVRELLCGDYGFNELMLGVPHISRSVLAQRLDALARAGLVARKARREGRGARYVLTAAGRELEPVVSGLGTWGKRWVHGQLDDADLDPTLLMWDMHRRLDLERLPREPTMVMFWFTDLPAKRSRYWLRLNVPEVEVCLTNPGFDVSLTIETKLRTLVEVWRGERSPSEAVRTGAIVLDGLAPLRQSFPSWLMLSTFAGVKPAPDARVRRKTALLATFRKRDAKAAR
jgi:DNA-binding HxlR family transcriptional regulator